MASLAALPHNLTRALATLAGFALDATTATIRRTLIAIPARLVVRSAKR